MIHFKIFFNDYKWTIEVFIEPKEQDAGVIESRLKQIGCSDKCIDRALDTVLHEHNSGFVYTKMEHRYSVMAMDCGTSMDEFINTYHHEKNHIEMHIAEYYNIDPMSEEASKMSGDLA